MSAFQAMTKCHQQQNVVYTYVCIAGVRQVEINYERCPSPSFGVSAAVVADRQTLVLKHFIAIKKKKERTKECRTGRDRKGWAEYNC